MRFLQRSSICILFTVVAVIITGTALGATPKLPKDLVMTDTFKPGYGAPIGKFRTVQGKVVIMHADKKEGYWAKKDLPLYKGDVIVTQKKSRTNFIMTDKSIISLSSNTKLVLTKSVYDEKKKRCSSFLSLSLGKARFIVSKLLSFKRKEFKVKTVTAVCGVRGSDFIVVATDNFTEVTALERTELYVSSNANPDEPPLIIKDFERTGVELGKVPYAAEIVPPEEIQELKQDVAIPSEETATGEQQDVQQEESSEEDAATDESEEEDTAAEESQEEGAAEEDTTTEETQEEGAAEEDTTTEETQEEGAAEEDTTTEETQEEGAAEEDTTTEETQEEGAAEEDAATEETQEGATTEEGAPSEETQADEPAASDTETEDTQVGESAEGDTPSGEAQADEPAVDDAASGDIQASEPVESDATAGQAQESEPTGDQDAGSTAGAGGAATGKTVGVTTGTGDTSPDVSADQDTPAGVSPESDIGQTGETVVVETEGGVDPGAVYVAEESLVEPELPTEIEQPVVDIENIIVDVVQEPEVAEQVAEQMLQEDLEIPQMPGTPE